MGYNPCMAGFYTGKGDEGYTGVLGEGRFPKYHPKLDTIGCIDEANAVLGLARANSLTPGVNFLIITIQRDLYHLMAEISATPENVSRFRVVDTKRVEWLEIQIEFFGNELSMPKDFIVPGDSPSGAAFALARTTVRRAERRVSQLFHEKLVDNPQLLRYLNRLSSLCFVLELRENQTSGSSSMTLASNNP
jgi:cob(I)alamin adenosyltransferase